MQKPNTHVCKSSYSGWMKGRDRIPAAPWTCSPSVSSTSSHRCLTLWKNLFRVLSASCFTNEETEIQRLESAMRSWANRHTDQEGICLRHNYLAGLNSGIGILANGSRTKKQNSGLLNSNPLLLLPLQEAGLGQWANFLPQVLTTPRQWSRVARGRSRCFWAQPSRAHCTPHRFLCKHSLIFFEVLSWIKVKTDELTPCKLDRYPQRKENGKLQLSSLVHHQFLCTPDVPVKETSVHRALCIPFFILPPPSQLLTQFTSLHLYPSLSPSPSNILSFCPHSLPCPGKPLLLLSANKVLIH